MSLENKTTHIAFRASPSLAIVINRCVQEGGWRNKSEMLRELFSELVEQIKNQEVKGTLVEDKR